MNRSWSFLLCGALVSSVLACGSDNTTPADSGVTPPTDTGTPPADTGMPPADGGARACYSETAAAPVCPMRRFTPANPMQPAFRLTHIQITAPAVLTTVLGVVNSAIYQGRFLWGIKLDRTANTFTTGALNPAATQLGTVGLGLLDGSYAFYNNNAPAAGGMPNRWDPARGMTTAMGDRLSAAMPQAIRLPIFNDDGSISVELPLRGATLRNMLVPADGSCIGRGDLQGGAFNECRSPWLTQDAMMMSYADLEACVTPTDAQTVTITALGGQTLCQLLSGANCTNTMMAMWPRQPDGMVDGMPCYTLRARFAAVSANIP
jgi:hypothetical protein